ncbi:alpha/beta-hydrolase [Rostrohypoxylon terebratum]|nr:alpha/beta-hydrolase [Rostrohypoxylon terebratum]
MASVVDISLGLLKLRLGLSEIMTLTAIVAIVAVAAWVSVKLARRPGGKTKDLFIPSPGIARPPEFQEGKAADLPYPLDALPGGRNVITPYGSLRAYEWGPEEGERVLFVHGISTPVVALGDLGHEFANRGYRVMLFDLFGRGYSDAPKDLEYDARLYVTQILLVLASSKQPWTMFHLVGYSLGGGLSVSFTRYFPHLVSSLTLVATGGLIRPYHVGWQSHLLYHSGLIPELIVRILVKRRLRPKDEQQPSAAGGADIVSAEAKKHLPNGDGDSNGGDGFDSAVISKFRPGVTIASVMRWQVDHHEGFITAFLSTIRNAPIYAALDDWMHLAQILEARRRSERDNESKSDPGIQSGKVLIVLGDSDPVVVKEEMIEDAERVLGTDGVEFAILPGGHEIPFTSSTVVASTVDAFLHRCRL